MATWLVKTSTVPQLVQHKSIYCSCLTIAKPFGIILFIWLVHEKG